MQHELHRVPVTALAFWRDHVILAGEGYLLKAYDISSGTLLGATVVFESQPIHGIIVTREADGAHVFIYGGSLACRAALHLLPDGVLAIDRGSVHHANDWILDAASSEGDEDQVAFVTAHNALSIAATGDNLETCFTPLVEGSNCILYSANITWLSPSECLIASGTAFGDVIVWSCTIRREGDALPALHHTHYTFSAHQGSVFGVQLSSQEIAGQVGGRQRILVTCSDDRTICLWDVSDMSIKTLPLGREQRQTGFGSDPSSDIHAPHLLAKVLGGHQSRIWHVRFAPPVRHDPETCSANGNVSIVSFGEDASTVVWTLEDKSSSAEEVPYTFRRLDTLNAHSGKNIWSVALDQSSGIASGAADGSLVLRAFNAGKAAPFPDMISAVNFGGKDTADICRAYAFVGPGKLMASTDHGRLLILSLRPSPSVHEVSQDVDGLEGYSVMAAIPDLAFVAGKQGAVYAYSLQSKRLCKIMDVGRKVAGVFGQQRSGDYGHGKPRVVHLLVTIMGSTSANLCRIDDACAGDISVACTTELQLPSGFVVTSFVHDQREPVDVNVAILGSRSGSIALFELTDDKRHGPTLPSLLLDEVHGKESVTCLQTLAEDAGDRSGILLSTGRDGTYAAHKLSRVSDRLDVDLVHQLSLPFGPNIEGIGKSHDGRLRVWGFRSKQFVVHDIDMQREIMTVDCGGAHRNWSFQSDINGGSFVWTKASKMKLKSQKAAPYLSSNSGGHGREIKATAVSPTEQNLIATGAEDTNIKLSRLEDGKFRCLHTLRKHNTGIQHLQWSRDGQYLFSSGGFEEFYVWRISDGVSHLELGAFCESQHPNSGASELRIMGFDIQSQASDTQLGSFEFWMAYSDSTVRLWQYGQRQWSLVSEGDYLTSCLTHCISFRGQALFTASTDGHVAEWHNDTRERAIRWDQRHKVHQSAILSMVMTELTDDSPLLLTGGDDNAIGISRLNKGDLQTLLLPDAHAAAVTGLAIVHNVEDSLWFVSASIDQRLKLWRLDTNLAESGINGFNVKLVKNVFTAVADVSSLEQMKTAGDGVSVLVCGVGMDIWKLDLNELKD